MDISMSVLSIFPPKLIGYIMRKTVYKPGSMAYEATAHNHFKAGYAVNEILEDAGSLGITLPRLEEAVNHSGLQIF